MAYDEYLADRIKRVLEEKHISYDCKKMMGGLIFQVDGKMLGIHIDKKYGDSLLMCRIGEEAYEREIGKQSVLPMNFTGRPMPGYVFVTPEGFDLEDDLAYWIDLAYAFNPLAKTSKKR